MPLKLGRQPRRLYRTNTLKQVICQVRHPYQHRYQDPAYLAGFEKHLGERFPRSARQSQVALSLGPNGLASAPVEGHLWRFTDVSGHWAVAVAPDSVSLEVGEFNYTQFEDFLDAFRLPLQGLLDAGVALEERLGFRMVNEIRHPEATLATQWKRFMNPDLLGIVAGGLLGDDIVHAVQEIRIRQPDGILAIRHGYLGPEPSNANPFYLLDLDYFHEGTVPLDMDGTLDQVTAFHGVLKDIFEASVTDALRTHLVVDRILSEPVAEAGAQAE